MAAGESNLRQPYIGEACGSGGGGKERKEFCVEGEEVGRQRRVRKGGDKSRDVKGKGMRKGCQSNERW